MKNIIQQIFGKHLGKKTPTQLDWVDDIAEMDDLAALKFSQQQLANMTANMHAAEAPNYQVFSDLLIRLEELNYHHLAKLSAQFVQVEHLKPELEINISETCYNYCRQSYISHLKVIEKIINQDKLKVDDSISIIIIARALYAALNMMKWRMYIQANPPTKMWLQVFMLYRIASQLDLLNIPFENFSLTPSITLSAYFTQLCMLGNLVEANPPRYQVDIAQRVLSHWLTRAHISKVYTPEQYLFFIDLEKDSPAKRMRNLEPNENCRYWELDELEKQIAIGLTVSDRGEIPENLSLAHIANAEQLNDTLRMMLAHWTRTNYVRQRRKEIREAASKTAKVTAGIINIGNQVQELTKNTNDLSAVQMGQSLFERQRASTSLTQLDTISLNSGSLDTWIVTDESQHGLGIRVNKYANILARPNKLIGLIIDDNPDQLLVGIIRSVKPTTANQLKVGVEIMSKYPKWVRLKQLSDEQIFTEATTETITNKFAPVVDIGLFSGIYLPIDAGLSAVSTLLLPKVHYRPHTSYAVNISGTPAQIQLGEPVESHDDWVKVAFPF